MNCNDARTLLEAKERTPLQEEQLNEHLKSCEDCRSYSTYRLDCLTLDDETPLPESFKSNWRQSIKEEEKMKKPVLSPKVKRILSLAAVFVLVIAGTIITRDSTAPSKTDDYNYNDYAMPPTGLVSGYGNADYALDEYALYEEAAPQSAEKSASMDATMRSARDLAGGQAEVKSPAKLIRTVDMSISTREFDEDYQKIIASLKKLGGYVESSTINSKTSYRRQADLYLRVPQEKLDKFLEDIGGLGRQLSFSESAEDVSEKYADTETRLETQQEKMKRLQQMLSKATSIEELIIIETSIADTQYQIDSLTGSLKGMDSRVNYSPVYISLIEERPADIEQVKEASLGERITSAFLNSIKSIKDFLSDSLVFVVSIAPIIIALLVVIIIIHRAIKKRRNKNEK